MKEVLSGLDGVKVFRGKAGNIKNIIEEYLDKGKLSLRITSVSRKIPFLKIILTFN
jgi:hypothetical protein